MSPPIGFALITHQHPGQIHRLVARLNILYDHPPIALHHAFERCLLDVSGFGGNVRVVRPHTPTRWCHWSVLHAMHRALRLLRESADPEWTVLLSGSCYPVAPAPRVLHDMRSRGGDAYLDLEEIPLSPAIPRNENEKLWEFQKRHTRRMFEFPLPSPKGVRYRRLYLPAALSRPFVPFGHGLRSFAGSGWYAANRTAVRALLEFPDANPKAMRFFRAMRVPDESYPHSVLMSTPGIRVVPTNFRCIRWVGKAASPRLLTEADLPDLLSGAFHFARKFDPRDAALLDAIDRAVDADALGADAAA